MDKYDRVTLPRKQIFVNNIVGGIGWAIGASLGLALLVIVVGSILSRVNLIPIVGDFVSEVAQEAVKNNPHLVE